MGNTDFWFFFILWFQNLEVFLKNFKGARSIFLALVNRTDNKLDDNTLKTWKIWKNSQDIITGSFLKLRFAWWKENFAVFTINQDIWSRIAFPISPIEEFVSKFKEKFTLLCWNFLKQCFKILCHCKCGGRI